MHTARKPVIVNHLGADFGRRIAQHPSAPVVIDDPFPAEPWRIAAEAEILATGSFTAWRLTPQDWRFAATLKWVQTQSTGVENFPPVLLKDRVMTCGRGVNAVPIAEFVFAAMLRIEKRLEDTRARAEADWTPHDIGRLYGRTLGLIGYGSIGQAIARRARAFDMKVLVSRRSPWQGEDGIIACGSVADVFAAADHLVVAAPLTPETAGMIDEALFRAAKPGLHFINVSRGGLVDQDALIRALEAGTIGQATLDVTTPEPLPDGHPLYAMPNVVISPHISWAGGDQDEAIRERFLANLDAYLAGRPLSSVVDPTSGY
ncbi:NAD(P)-dependent oxidoreductase [Rhizobium sp. GN54]|uniref:NAD(P)-dependent oxidoreductase n=1 Tax=Rhizobium sp. GN54 TaxID=2898150 RepID=UPI001E377657|nr:NAD(P)-dependent oxidoreductase [Rhizobium sp. GN54]MCD2182866.1 glyoxylate reductase (NADP(+)) [Rhizobium sp. GN54]